MSKISKRYIDSSINPLRSRMTGHWFDFRHVDLSKLLITQGLEHGVTFHQTRSENDRMQ